MNIDDLSLITIAVTTLAVCPVYAAFHYAYDHLIGTRRKMQLLKDEVAIATVLLAARDPELNALWRNLAIYKYAINDIDRLNTNPFFETEKDIQKIVDDVIAETKEIDKKWRSDE